METIYAISWTVFLMVVWFDTDAFVRYVRLFRLPLFGVNKYVEENERKDIPLEYVDYLRLKFADSFHVALITCPTCLCVWISAIFCLSFCGLSTEGLLLLPFVFLPSLIVYLLVRKLMR